MQFYCIMNFYLFIIIPNGVLAKRVLNKQNSPLQRLNVNLDVSSDDIIKFVQLVVHVCVTKDLPQEGTCCNLVEQVVNVGQVFGGDVWLYFPHQLFFSLFCQQLFKF